MGLASPPMHMPRHVYLDEMNTLDSKKIFAFKFYLFIDRPISKRIFIMEIQHIPVIQNGLKLKLFFTLI